MAKSLPALAGALLFVFYIVLSSGRVCITDEARLKLNIAGVSAFVLFRGGHYLCKRFQLPLPFLSYLAAAVVLFLIAPFFRLNFPYPGPSLLLPFDSKDKSELALQGYDRLSGRRAKLDFEVRESLIFHTNNAIKKRLNIPAQSSVRFGLGIKETGPDPYHMVVFIKDMNNPAPQKVYSRLIKRDKPHWEDISIDLSGHAGANKTLVLQVTTTGKKPLSHEIYLSPPKLDTPRALASLEGYPNVVIILVDTLRPDHMNTYGYDVRETDPAVNMLWKKRGVKFDKVYSPSSWTPPAVAGLFTSKLMSEHGVGMDHVSHLMMREELELLPEMLQKRGYDTVGLSLSWLISPIYNSVQGFDSFYDLSYFQFYWHGDMKAARKARKWLDRERPRPFFMYIHLMNPHSPYSTPPFMQSGPILQMKGFAIENYFRSHAFNFYEILTFPDPPWEEGQLAKNELLENYDGEIKRSDEAIEQVLFALEYGGYMDNTIVFVTSDHGEEFNEHGGFFHGRTVFQEVIHVPLIVAAPDMEEAGESVSCPVGLIDIAPSVLEKAGVPRPSGMRGRSLWPLIEEGTCYERTFFSEIDNGKFGGLKQAVVRDNMKMVREKHDGELTHYLYDLAADPAERDNLAESRPQTVREFSAMLEPVIRTRTALLQHLEQDSLSSRERKILKSIGYLE